MEERISAHAQLGLLLRLLHQHWVQAIHAALDDAGFGDVRPSHANVFTFVPAAGIQVSELTQLAHVRKQTMAQAVEELEQLGYVERRRPAVRRSGGALLVSQRRFDGSPLEFDELWQEALLGFTEHIEDE